MTGSDASWLAVAGHLHQACRDVTTILDDLQAAIRRGDPHRLRAMQDRYEAGQKEHHGAGGDWDGWDPIQFLMAVDEELVDAVIYLAEHRRRVYEKAGREATS